MRKTLRAIAALVLLLVLALVFAPWLLGRINELRARIISTFGVAEPVHLRTTVGFIGGATVLGIAIDQGMARHEGDKLISHIEFRGGQLLINGKPPRLPGVRPPATI